MNLYASAPAFPPIFVFPAMVTFRPASTVSAFAGVGDPVRTENGDRPGGHFRQVLDETRALRAQGLDDMAVVHDFMPDIDRRAKLCQRLLDDVDGPDYAGAEPARLRKHHMHGRCNFSRGAKGLIDCIGKAAACAAGDRPSKQ